MSDAIYYRGKAYMPASEPEQAAPVQKQEPTSKKQKGGDGMNVMQKFLLYSFMVGLAIYFMWPRLEYIFSRYHPPKNEWQSNSSLNDKVKVIDGQQVIGHNGYHVPEGDQDGPLGRLTNREVAFLAGRSKKMKRELQAAGYVVHEYR